MAEKLNAETAAKPVPKDITDIQLTKLSKEFRDLKETAAEANGDAGQLIKNAVKDHNLDRNAFKWAHKCTTMDPDKAQATIRNFIKYARMLGVLDQKDLFETVDPAEPAEAA